jgi:hypothetical protein
MKILKTLSATTLAMAMIVPTAQAIPTFDTLADEANSAGANITKSLWDTAALGYDSLWSGNGMSELKFKSEISGYNNTMGYADPDGGNQVQVLTEGNQPGNWISIAAAPDPFIFYLDTGQSNTWFSQDSLNADAQDHLLVFQRLSGASKYLLFWDDQDGGGDRDFNDFVARANFIDVPAPGAFALLGLGLLGFGYTRRRVNAKFNA